MINNPSTDLHGDCKRLLEATLKLVLYHMLEMIGYPLLIISKVLSYNNKRIYNQILTWLQMCRYVKSTCDVFITCLVFFCLCCGSSISKNLEISLKCWYCDTSIQHTHLPSFLSGSIVLHHASPLVYCAPSLHPASPSLLPRAERARCVWLWGRLGKEA